MSFTSSFNVLFEDDMGSENPTMTEAQVSAEVEVKVHDDNEEEQTLLDEVETIEKLTEVAEQVTEATTVAAELRANIIENGLSPQAYTIARMFIPFDKIVGATLPAVEAMDTTGRNYEAAQMVITACEAMENSWWEKIKTFFKNLWQRIKDMYDRFFNSTAKLQKSVGAISQQLKNVDRNSVDASKIECSGTLYTVKDFEKAVQLLDKMYKATHNSEDVWESFTKNHANNSVTNLSDAGYTLDSVSSGSAYREITKLLAKKDGLKNKKEKIEKACKEAISAIDKKSDGAKEKIEEMRKQVQAESNNITGGIRITIACCKAYIYAGNKLLADSKKSKKDSEKE